jgi:predicted acyltransferase
MTTAIFTSMAYIGFFMFIVGSILIFKEKENKKSWLVWTAGQTLVLPLATHNVIEGRSSMPWVAFVIILVTVFVGIYNLSRNEKKK